MLRDRQSDGNGATEQNKIEKIKLKKIDLFSVTNKVIMVCKKPLATVNSVHVTIYLSLLTFLLKTRPGSFCTIHFIA